MTKVELLKAELEKIGIHNERELNEAIDKIEPLDLSLMTAPIDKERKVS